jgi:putative FmdB family regulatory protein
MPQKEFMCLECGHTFTVYSGPDEEEEDLEAECPACGGTDTTRTYDEDTDVSEDDLKEQEEEKDDLGDINLDEE